MASRSVVGREVVEYDNIAGLQPWTEGLAHELDEPRPFHGTDEGLTTENTITAYDAEDRRVHPRQHS